MPARGQRIYAVPSRTSDQAEANRLSPSAGRTDTRILIELQVISYLLHQAGQQREDLQMIRESIAASLM